jgi:membrane associated rhomboid family serine protease
MDPDFRPGSWLIMMKNLNIVVVLIGINALFFFSASSTGGQLLDNLALYFPKNEHFGIWQFATHMFMHANFMHIFFNMFALWMFGSPLEKIWGRNRFLVFYFLSGIGAALIYTLINYYQFDAIYSELIDHGLSPDKIQTLLDKGMYLPGILSEEKGLEFYKLYQTPMVGASGAIYGILVAFGFTYPNTKLMFILLPVPIAAKFFIPAIIALDLFSGITGFSIFGGGVAHFAHVGGAIIGFLLMYYWKETVGRIQA